MNYLQKLRGLSNSVLGFLALTLAINLVVSCNKSDKIQNVLQEPIMSVERDDLSQEALNDTSTVSKADFYGKTYYDHMKHHYSTTNPRIYMDASIGDKIFEQYEIVKQETKGQDSDVVLAELIELGLLSSATADQLNAFSQLASSYGETNPTFGQVWNDFKAFEVSVLDSETPENEKMVVLEISSLLRHHIKRQYELGLLFEQRTELNGVITDRNEECLAGIKISCWEKKFKKEVLNLLKGTVYAVVGIALGDAKEVVKAFKDALLAYGGIGYLIIFIELSLDDTCKCDYVTPADPCAPPTNVGLSLLNNCDLYEQFIQVTGQGTNANSYTYAIQNGYFPEFTVVAPNGTPTYSTFVTTTSNIIKVKQTGSAPIVVSVVVNYINCQQWQSGYGLPPMILNIPLAVASVGTVAIVGAQNISLGDPTTFTYTCTGTWLANANCLMTNMGPSYHGQVMTSGSNLRGIKWNVATSSPYNMASVSATVQNNCGTPVQTTSTWLAPISIQ
jgi:hypothetical protein